MTLACGDDDDGKKTADGGVDAAAADAAIDGDAALGADGSVPGDAAAGGDSGMLDGSVPSTDGGSPFVYNDAGQVLCGNVVCACADGIDGDNDGLIDLADPECVSAWDNDEASFATGISGDNRDDACQDCFFDGNSGAGNDGCRIASSCLTTGTPTSGQGACDTCVASTKCMNFCQAYTPNGCDCFGCCGVQLGSNIVKNVMLGAGCSIDGDNLAGCTECIPSTTCGNTCGRCELCPGKTLADLPSDCGSTAPDGGVPADAGSVTPAPVCDDGATACGAGQAPCAGGWVCTFGCCVLSPVI